MDVAVDLTLLVIAWAHVLISPYTKVEESFNLHATHDVFFYGVTPEALKSVCLTILLFMALTYVVLL
jgi:alpha-1,6-mannosyltransferase